MSVAEAIGYIEISDIRYLGGYSLEISFNDGKQVPVDFRAFLEKSQHPEIRKYLDPQLFEGFTHEYGHLHWNDYDLSFSNEDLYSGVID